MKRLIAFFLFLVTCLLFSGCSRFAVNTDPEATQTGVETDDVESLREELAELKILQAMQAQAYEAEISRLQAELQERILSETKNEEKENGEEDLSKLFSTKAILGGVEILSYLGDESEVVIPAEIGGERVLTIGEGAFRNSPVTGVILPDGVRKIDWFCFYGCYRLESVTLPESLEKIEYGAFDLCGKGLTFSCPKNSYAEAYAKSYGIPTA